MARSWTAAPSPSTSLARAKSVRAEAAAAAAVANMAADVAAVAAVAVIATKRYQELARYYQARFGETRPRFFHWRRPCAGLRDFAASVRPIVIRPQANLSATNV